MIFEPKEASQVASGRKTQTRRPVQRACRFRAGTDYPVRPRGKGKAAICRVTVLSVREERLGAITHADARAEGFRNTATFKAHWVRTHDAKWAERQGETSESALLDRFNARHADKLVTVITFTLLRDEPRYLATQRDILTGRAEEYTTQRHRAIDELEVIGPTAGYVAAASKVGEDVRLSAVVRRRAEWRRRKAERGRRAA